MAAREPEWIEVNRRLVELVADVKVLSRLSWPRAAHDQFLESWRRGDPRLPDPEYAPASLGDRVEALRGLRTRLDRSEPIQRYLDDTIQSYVTLCRLLEAVGSPRMGAYSIQLYGRPGDSLTGGKVDNKQAAEHFLEVARYFRSQGTAPPTENLPADALQAALSSRLEEVFPPGTVRIVVDDALAAKAAAGATRIRLRRGSLFAPSDCEQLLQHEAFVHSLTALNGRRQSKLSALGLGAPRTTGTQEGLATFAELITGAIDIGRLERIALRILGIDHALAGADFIDVFRFFLEAGQGESESFHSAMRIFRGAPLSGGSAFTKDTVYLHGLLEVHTFFRWCLRHRRLSLARHIFAGRLTIGDALRLAPSFEDGTLDVAPYLPPWMGRSNALAAYLAFSVFANHIRIGDLDAGFTFDDVTELGETFPSFDADPS